MLNNIFLIIFICLIVVIQIIHGAKIQKTPETTNSFGEKVIRNYHFFVSSHLISSVCLPVCIRKSPDSNSKADSLSGQKSVLRSPTF